MEPETEREREREREREKEALQEARSHQGRSFILLHHCILPAMTANNKFQTLRAQAHAHRYEHPCDRPFSSPSPSSSGIVLVMSRSGESRLDFSFAGLMVFFLVNGQQQQQTSLRRWMASPSLFSSLKDSLCLSMVSVAKALINKARNRLRT